MHMLPCAQLADGGCGGVINGFHQQPAAWSQRADELAQNLIALAKMLEDEAGMNEIERGLRQHLGDDVMASHLDIGQSGDVDKMARIEIGGEDMPSCSHARRQPFRDRAAARTQFQASPACGNASPLQEHDRAGIEKFLDRIEPGAPLAPGVVEQIRLIGHARQLVSNAHNLSPAEVRLPPDF